MSRVVYINLCGHQLSELWAEPWGPENWSLRIPSGRALQAQNRHDKASWQPAPWQADSKDSMIKEEGARRKMSWRRSRRSVLTGKHIQRLSTAFTEFEILTRHPNRDDKVSLSINLKFKGEVWIRDTNIQLDNTCLLYPKHWNISRPRTMPSKYSSISFFFFWMNEQMIQLTPNLGNLGYIKSDWTIWFQKYLCTSKE